MLETEDLILDKAKESDWSAMYRNVWSRPESARYMLWNLTTNEEDAKSRILRTIEFQETHDAYFVYEKASGEAIGFAGVGQLAPGIFEETGICLGAEFTHRGYGKQILSCLIQHCKNEFGAKEFLYSTRSQNLPSVKLAKSFGFALFGEEEKTDDRSGEKYILQKYRLML